MRKNVSLFILILHQVLFIIIYLIPFNIISEKNDEISLTFALILLFIIYLSTFSILYKVIFKEISIYVFGIMVFIVGFLCNIVAIIISPEYFMWKWSISVLTHHPGGGFMRIGFIISYNLAIPFFIKFGRLLKAETINDHLRKLAVACGIFTSVAAMLAGTFSGRNTLNSTLHGLFALLSWLGGAVVCLLFGLLMLKNSRFSKSISNFSFLISGFLLFYLIPFFIVNFCNLFPETSPVYAFGRNIYFIMPLFEWIVIFSVFTWYLFISIHVFRENIN